jgi:mono/diheme cytochrome c family protein
MTLLKLCGVAAVLAVAARLTGFDPAAQDNTKESRSARDGVYSAAQAARGEKTYKAKCGNCHMADQFSGFVFMQSWSGQSAYALYEQLRTTMPQDNPGSLKPQEYADLIAYIFKINRLPTGDTELKGTKPALSQVIIEEPEKQ